MSIKNGWDELKRSLRPLPRSPVLTLLQDTFYAGFMWALRDMENACKELQQEVDDYMNLHDNN